MTVPVPLGGSGGGRREVTYHSEAIEGLAVPMVPQEAFKRRKRKTKGKEKTNGKRRIKGKKSE